MYSNLIQLRIHADSITWNRFYNFLMFNTILVLSWATLYVADPRPICVLIAICLFGGLSGVTWAILGYRGRRFLRELMTLASNAENDPTIWSSDLGNYKPTTLEVHLRDTLKYPWAGTYKVLVWGPSLFTLFYVVLLVISVI